LQFQTVDLRFFAHLPDEERVDSAGVSRRPLIFMYDKNTSLSAWALTKTDEASQDFFGRGGAVGRNGELARGLLLARGGSVYFTSSRARVCHIWNP
jgi:hypothetical protein